MTKDIKSIQGSQRPNPIGPECIRVNKIYDWVVLSNRDRNKVPIDPDLFAAIETCRHNGNAVTATCEEVIGSRICNIVGHRPANIPGIASAQIVTLAQDVHFLVTFLCGTTVIGTQLIPVAFIDDVILCFPEGTTINCQIFDTACTVVFNEMLGNMLLLEVVVCKDVQVEAEVKLEVEAKFCGPRQVIPIEELAPQCDRFPLFPEQCPEFFPAENCLCRGSASLSDVRTITVTSGAGLAPVTGTLTLNTTICDNCTLSESDLTVRFQDIPGGEDPNVNQSFNFFATRFNQPTCTPAGTLTVTGVGTFTLAGQQPVNASFTLILNDAANTVQLFISDQSGQNLLVVANIAVPNTTVGDCSRF
jgi:hypothetical protein